MVKKNSKGTQPLTQHLAPFQVRSEWASIWLVLLILLAGLLAYSNSFAGKFLLDDRVGILENEQIKHPWPPWPLLKSRRPVVALSLAFNYALGGLKPWGYHFFNLAVHLLSAMLLFGVVRRTMSLGRMKHASRETASWFAVSVALLWVIHPLQTQSVTYVIQRSESLMGLFYLATLYCMIRGASSAKPLLWYGMSVACCALGMGSKAVMVTAPVIMLLYDRVFLSRSMTELIKRRWMLHLGLVATWNVLVFCGVFRGVLNPSTDNVTVGFGLEGISPLDYAMTQPGVIVHYLRLALWPQELCLDYGWPIVNGYREIVLSGIAVLALVIGVVWAFLRKPWLAFTGAWFFIILGPTSSFIPIKDPAFEHRMYLPLAAVLIVIVAMVVRLMSLASNRLGWGVQPRRMVLFLLMLIVCSMLGAATYRRNALYHDPVLIWQDTVDKAPHHARAHNTLGWVLLEKGRVGKAIRKFQDAIARDSGFAAAHANLGIALLQKRDYRRAIEAFRKAFEVDPREFGAMFHLKLANAYYLAGEHTSAIESFESVMDIDPEACRESDYLHLGNALKIRGRLDEAVAAFQKSVEINPNYDKGHYSLGDVLSRRNDVEGAIAAYRKALRINPRYFEANVRLGILLDFEGRPSEAVDCYQKALRYDSDMVNSAVRLEARYQLGASLMKLQRFDEAAASFRAALRIDSNHSGSQRGLQAALRKQG